MILLIVIAAVAMAFMPQPVPVDVAPVTRGPMRVTVDEDGKTRIKEKYVVSSPLSGRLLRIGLDPGDAVIRDQTPVAILEPRDPDLLDARALAESEARVAAAAAAVDQATPELEAAKARLELAESDLRKTRSLHESGAATDKELDDARLALRVAQEAYNASRFGEEIARFELELAKAALITATPSNNGNNSEGGSGVAPSGNFVIRSPSSGRVLRVFQESAAVITAGSPLLEVGDPTDLELEVDVLSSDAVRIAPGADVILEHWGGDQPLHGTVRRVEPAAFTKVSALGVEEQRVNVIIDFAEPPDARQSLGDGFRVEARIVVWEAGDVLKVPTSALFRSGNDWAVFRLGDAGTARLTPIEIGGQTGLDTQVTSGLNEGDNVIVHPSDQISDGTAVRARPS